MRNPEMNDASRIRKRNSILIAVVALAVILFCVVNGIQLYRMSAIGLPSPMETFVGEQSGFSIKYPRSWSAHETPTGNHGDQEVIGIISRVGSWFPAVTIARREYTDGDIVDVTDWGRARIDEKHPFATYRLVTADRLDSGKYQGILHEYLLEEPTLFGTVLRHCEDWYVLHEGFGYSLSFCVHEAGWPQVQGIFQEMIQSFVVEGN